MVSNRSNQELYDQLTAAPPGLTEEEWRVVCNKLNFVKCCPLKIKYLKPEAFQ